MESTDTIWLFSVPIIVIVHTKQECAAWGKICWENTFEKNNIIRGSENQLEYELFEERLNQKYYSVVFAELSQTNKDALRSFFDKDGKTKDLIVSYENAFKVKVLKFSFWDLFYNAIKLLSKEEKYMEMVRNGHIMGFITYDQTFAKLINLQNGTFLIRFSESKLGNVKLLLYD